MKRVLLFALILLLPGCSAMRPVKAVGSDLSEDGLKGEVKKITEMTREIISVNEDIDDLPNSSLAVTEYNAAGNITKAEIYDAESGKLISSDDYEYDDAGLYIINSESRNYKDRTYTEYDYKYDRHGRMTGESDRVSYSTIYKYDHKGYLKKKTIILDDKISSKAAVVKYKYDSRGRLKQEKQGKKVIKYIYGDDGSFVKTDTGDAEEYYDADGNLIKHTYFIKVEEEGKIKQYDMSVDFVFGYEFDDKGNWTKRMMFYEGDPIRVHLREIEYY